MPFERERAELLLDGLGQRALRRLLTMATAAAPGREKFCG